MPALAIIGSAWLAFFNGRRLVRMLQELNHSTARMSQGDYTQPVQTLRRDELGDLQRTVDQMRQSLSETTITKNYLDNVLNSMSDAVFVTAADGAIKITNVAAQRLTGSTDAAARRAQHRLAAARARTPTRPSACSARAKSAKPCCAPAAGQTIPVSFTGSAIDTADPQFAGCIYVARDITDRKRAERRIRYLARYDALTKMPEPHAVPAPAAAGHRARACARAPAWRCCTSTWTASRK